MNKTLVTLLIAICFVVIPACTTTQGADGSTTTSVDSEGVATVAAALTTLDPLIQTVTESIAGVIASGDSGDHQSWQDTVLAILQSQLADAKSLRAELTMAKTRGTNWLTPEQQGRLDAIIARTGTDGAQ